MSESISRAVMDALIEYWYAADGGQEEKTPEGHAAGMTAAIVPLIEARVREARENLAKPGDSAADLREAVEEALSLSHEILPQTIDDVIAIVREHDGHLIAEGRHG